MKKQAKNKFLSLLLSVAMILSCSAPALAVDDGQPTDNAPAAETVETNDLQLSPETVKSLTEEGAFYKDGTYEGTGTGYKDGEIKLNVTITDGKISKVELVSQQKQSYWDSKNVASLFDKIVEANSADVDGISGATKSSNGVKAAVRDALSKAEASTPETPEEQIFASGSGTKQDPYLIKTAEQLQAFAGSVNGGEDYQGQYVSLNNDLDLSGIDWTPIGSTGVFKGVFDGGNNTISNLSFGTASEPAEKENVGLFGDLGVGGVIRNVGIQNAVVYNTYQGSQYVGLIAAGIGDDSVVENCWATGSITSKGSLTDNGRYSSIGGLVGSNGLRSLVANSWSDVTIDSSSRTDNSVGGIVGQTSNNSAVINCAAFGDIEDTSDGSFSAVGGVVGYSSGAVYACYSDSNLTSGHSSYENGADVPIGGVVGGTSYMAAAYNCYFNSDAKQAYYGGNVSDPVAVGYDAINWSASDNEYCEGLTAAEIKGKAISEKLAAALTEKQLAAAETWFEDEAALLGSGVTLDTFLSMTEGGWNSWEQGSNGYLLPTGTSSNVPDEPDYFDGGDGSKTDPYVISSEDHLRAFAEATVNSKIVTANKYFKLGADITLNGAWTPIHNFAGSFDGDNHTVSGMTIGTEASPVNQAAVGFFDTLPAGASVQNLNITGAAVYAKMAGSYADDRVSAGVLAGSVKNVKINNCTVQGTIVSASSGNFAYAGGLVGKVESDTYLTNCIADVPVKAVSTDYYAVSGGLIGYSGGSNLVANCAALGNVDVSGKSSDYNKMAAGGLIGYASFLVENCYAAGNVTLTNSASDQSAYVGALIGNQGGGVAVDSHYDESSTLTVNGETATAAAIGNVKKWNYADYNKVTAEKTNTKAFAATMNDGISEATLETTDTYLTSYPFNNSTNLFADVIAGRKTIDLNSWALSGSKVLFGEAEVPIFSSGDGTADNPYVIKTEAQLRAFAASTVDGAAYSGCYIVLDGDLELNGEWTPIHAFAGSFDGSNHTVSGMTIGTANAPKTMASAGFFDYLANGADVSNLKLTDAAVYVQTSGYDRCFAGALVGGTNSVGRNVTIDHCSVTGSAVSVKSEMYSYAGGLIGLLSTNAVVTNCWADIPVSAAIAEGATFGTAMAGGLIAGNGNYGMIANCAALGDVTASGVNFNANTGSFAGGLGGQLTGLIQNCYAAGDLSLTNAIKANTPYIGGLAGQLSSGVAVDGYYNSKAGASVNGEAVTLNALGSSSNSLTNSISGKTTNNTAFAATMNRGLSKAGMAAADEWLTGEEVGYTQVELNAMRPSTWYGWTLQNDKVLLSAKVYEEPKDPVGVFESGSGTEADPWIIKTAEQWGKFADSFSQTDYVGKYIALDADITLTDGQMPAGQTDGGLQTFKGVLDGRNHTISGLAIGSESSPLEDTECQMYYGLFAELENAAVKNLGIKDAKIYVTSDVSIMAGPLAGFVDNSTVDGCWATGTIKIRTTTEEVLGYNNWAGGLVGYSQYSNIVNSWTNTAVDAYCKTANAEAGGIAGLTSFGLVANCYTLGDVAAETDRSIDDGGVAYVGGIAGCQASTMVNCYTTSNVTARSWSQYVGAIAGMATAISKTYDSYYSENAKLTIVDSTVAPVVALGRTVPLGYNEDGEFMSGALVDGLEALSEMNTQALANKLNGNFSSFPADTDALGLTLKKWTVAENLVTFGTENADVTYVPIVPPAQVVEYKDGTYYGRDADKNVIVTVTVTDGKITSAEIVSPAGFDAANAESILAQVITDQEIKDASVGSDADKALKGALVVALNKALLGDTSGYGAADPDKIFDGGAGTEEAPFEIRTADQLRAFAAAVNEDEHFDGEYIILTADIDLTGEQWVPVGNAGAHYFGGTFDGKNHKISNMVIGTEAQPVDYVSSGLFACIDGAVVQNLGVKNASIVAKRSDNTTVYGGIIAAVADNTETSGGSLINNCTVSGSVSVSTPGQSYAGGIAGYSWHSIIANCGADVDLTAASTGSSATAGGIVALDGFSVVANNYALGSITANAGVNSSTIGGIAGMQAGVAGNNYADVTLKASNTTMDIGSLVGRNTGIAVLSYGYFNSEKTLQNGSVAQPAKDVGVNVTMFTTGVIENTEGKTGAFLHSQELAELLNHNQCDEENLRKVLSDGIANYEITLRTGKITIDSWKLDVTTVKQNKAPQMEESVEPVNPFVDVPGGAYYEDAVVWAVGKGITTGIDATHFEPDGICTRAEAVTFLWRAAGSPAAKSAANPFTDVKADSYYYDAVLWAVENGITKGTSATTFSPDDECTRAQIVTLLWRSEKSPAAGTTNPFTDVKSGSYYYDAVLWAVENGITNGTGATAFSPNNECTRAQIVTFLFRNSQVK